MTTQIQDNNGNSALTKQNFLEPPAHNLAFPQEKKLQQLVKKVKETMARKSREGGVDDHVEELVMIDAIQRLGLECYFRDDIHGVLRKCRETGGGDSLHGVALRFRLLRQAGYNVQAETFKMFKDKNGRFKEELENDKKGLISLFEASELSIPGDQILDEAADFTWNHLNPTSFKSVEGSDETAIIRNILNNPFHKSLPRLNAKNQTQNLETLLKFLHECFGTKEWIKEIQELAKIDVSMSQTTLKNEVNQVSRWWNELRMVEVLELARHQPAKWHMWSSVALPGPDKAGLRIELTKSISFVYIIDDIFDVYGKLKELTLFTEAVNRWEYANIEGLPDYMKLCLKALYDTTTDMSHKIYLKYGWNPKEFLKNAWVELCNAFLVEARWFASEHLPTTDEYLKNGVVSSGVFVVFATLFSLLGENANLWNNHPKLVTMTGTLLRLWDDLGSAKDEDQDGYDGSFLACYMNEYEGSSDESAREQVFEMISEAWKHLNEECLSHSPFSIDFKNAMLNLARMIPIMYKYDHNHRLPSLEKHMNSLLNE